MITNNASDYKVRSKFIKFKYYTCIYDVENMNIEDAKTIRK